MTQSYWIAEVLTWVDRFKPEKLRPAVLAYSGLWLIFKIFEWKDHTSRLTLTWIVTWHYRGFIFEHFPPLCATLRPDHANDGQAAILTYLWVARTRQRTMKWVHFPTVWCKSTVISHPVIISYAFWKGRKCVALSTARQDNDSQCKWTERIHGAKKPKPSVLLRWLCKELLLQGFL